MEHTKHLWRAVLLILVFGIVFVIGTRLMVPATFGDEGFYRAESRQEYMLLPVVHAASRKACGECHAKELEAHDKGAHAGVNCEACHAPWSDHVGMKDGKLGKIADMPKVTSRELCQKCHLQLIARPADVIKQIVPREHLEAVGAIEPGQPVPDGACVLCHSPHDPKQE